MSNYYNLDGIKTELEKRLSYERSILQAWENVTFPTKKDGTPFKVMSKNFENAKLYHDDFAWRDYEKKLIVNTFDKLNGYISEEIYCYNQVKYISDKSKLEKISNIMPKEPMLEQVYVYDLDDIKEEIQKTIERHKVNIISLQKQINQADETYREFLSAYKNAMDKLKDLCGCDDNSLYYAVRDTVKERYPYC